MASHRCLLFCGVLIGSPWGLSGLAAQDLGGSSNRANLDLPVSTLSAGGDSDEDAPEIVYLYGSTFEGDGFIFVGGPTC